MRYNLPIKIDIQDGKAPEAKDIFDALEKALTEASQDPAPFVAALEKEPALSDQWVIVDQFTGVALKDQPSSGENLSDLDLPAKAIWCRKDLVGTPPVIAEIHTDDTNQLGLHIVHRYVDIRPFLLDATADDIENLHVEDWSYAQSADGVAYDLERKGDPSAEQLFGYLSMNPTGFGVSIEGADALNWIMGNRPDLYEKISEYTKEDSGIAP